MKGKIYEKGIDIRHRHSPNISHSPNNLTTNRI